MSTPPVASPSVERPSWRVASVREGSRAERFVQVVEARWRWVLAAMLLLEGLILIYMGRGTTFYFDEWNFVTQDYGGGIHSLLLPHVGNISVFPIAVYKALFHVAGLNHYPVYRLAVVFLHLLSAGLIFVLASRRLDRAPALLATALILFLGAAWEDLLWAFQVGYMLSIAGGLGAWVLIEYGRRRTDLAAMLCLVVSAGSSSLGIAVMAGIVVELAWQGQWRRMWLVAAPVALYVIWYLGYGESQVTEASVIAAPGFAQDLFAAASGALVGRNLEWGRPLAALAVVTVVWRLVRAVDITPRLAGMLATGISLWSVTALARSTISTPETSRYLYLGAVVIVLVGVELLRGVPLPARAIVLAAALILSFAITGLTAMHGGAEGLRSTSRTVAASSARCSSPLPMRRPAISRIPRLRRRSQLVRICTPSARSAHLPRRHRHRSSPRNRARVKQRIACCWRSRAPRWLRRLRHSRWRAAPRSCLGWLPARRCSTVPVSRWRRRGQP